MLDPYTAEREGVAGLLSDWPPQPGTQDVTAEPHPPDALAALRPLGDGAEEPHRNHPLPSLLPRALAPRPELAVSCVLELEKSRYAQYAMPAVTVHATAPVRSWRMRRRWALRAGVSGIQPSGLMAAATCAHTVYKGHTSLSIPLLRSS